MEESSPKSKGEERITQELPTITLRPISLSDVDDFMVWASDARVSKYCLWDTYTSKEQAEDYIKNEAIPHPWLRVICVENRAIGAVRVKPYYGAESCRGELAYELGHSYWGRGIATRAIKMAVSAIFEEWPHLKRLQALTHVENKGSQRVLEKAGFEREGVLRKYALMKGTTVDAVMSSVLRNDCHVD